MRGFTSGMWPKGVFTGACTAVCDFEDTLAVVPSWSDRSDEGLMSESVLLDTSSKSLLGALSSAAIKDCQCTMHHCRSNH